MFDNTKYEQKRINQLPMEVANLVAAGEVVERPASAIKELMENSIDAGATFITVEIQDGGVTLMRVSDDGCGIERDQLPLAVKRHATSKISNASDLQSIGTLGFRGEALAAISAVSEFRMYSRTATDIMGGAIYVSNGEIKEWFDQGCAKGTTVIAEQLFGNVPARRKFLKKDVTETAAVTAAVERIALSHPEIRVRLITDGDLRLETTGDGKLINTIYSIFGREFASKLIEVEGEQGRVRVHGYVGRSDNIRGNRGAQHFYVNERYVRSNTMMAALEQAYVSYIAPGKFPVCVLFLELDPGAVDVNIHPTKLELKFANEKTVFEAVYYSVKEALEKNVSRPEMHIPGTGRSEEKPIGVKMTDAFAPVGREEPLSKRQMTVEELLAANIGQDPKKAPEAVVSVASPMPSSGVLPSSQRKEKSEGAEGEAIKRVRFVDTPMSERKNIAIYRPGRYKPSYPNGMISYREFGEHYIDKRNRYYIAKAKGWRKIKEPAHLRDLVLDGSVSETTVQDATRGMLVQSVVATRPEERPSAEPVDAVMNQPGVMDQACGAGEAQNSQAASVPSATRSAHHSAEPTSSAEAQPTPKAQPAAWRIAGQVFNSYIIVEIGERMLLVDKHAAHERIIFEKLKANLHAAGVVSQPMMVPVEVMMMSDEVTALSEYREELSRVGFEFEAKRNTVSVTAIPTGIEVEAVADMLTVMADRIKGGTGSVEITRDAVFEKALYQGSCKAAIKAGREYASGHERWIVEQMMQIPDITFCPHGRPVAMELSKSKIDKQFSR